jgi:hypothetical protein
MTSDNAGQAMTTCGELLEELEKKVEEAWERQPIRNSADAAATRIARAHLPLAVKALEGEQKFQDHWRSCDDCQLGPPDRCEYGYGLLLATSRATALADLRLALTAALKEAQG